MSFQSRLGWTAWIALYNDLQLKVLAGQGIKRLVIACPSFVAYCLETLEEIGIRAREQWQSLGGESLSLVPCVNNDDVWIESVMNLINRDRIYFNQFDFIYCILFSICYKISKEI